MLKPARVELRADRHADWEAVIQLGTDGEFVDLTGCTVEAAVRNYPDAPSTALIDLQPAVDPDEGTHIVNALTGEIALRINKTTLETLPVSHDPAAHRRFAWDLRITYGDGFREVFLYGPFYLYPGVVRDA